MLAIYKRELKSYFHSVVGLLFIAVTLFFVSLYFFICNLYSGYPYISYALSSVMILFLLSIPVLTMRILAEERRNKTDQLILTAPVSVGGIVMGKFLALMTILAIPTAVICTYPLIMTRFGTVPMSECYLAILGFFLYGMASIALGILISALTESQVIAAVLSFILLFGCYMMASFCSLISQTGNLLTKLLSLLDMETPFNEMMYGTLNLSSIVYFICLTAMALFLATQVIQKRRYSTSVKNFSLSAYSTAGIAMVVGVIVLINLVIGELPATWTNVDLTANKMYSLTDQTKEYLKSIDKDVTIYVLASEDSHDNTVGQTLKLYEDMNSHITVEYVDPTVNPKFYLNYTDSTTTNSIIVVSGDRNKVIDYDDLYVMEYDFDYTTMNYSSTVTGYDAEGQITSAIAFVLNEDMPKLYMTTGHGENSLESTFTDAIKKENIDYETLNLMDVESVPEDAAGLVIYAPTGDFSADDKDMVLEYLERGGNVIFVAGVCEYSKCPNLTALLAYMGMEITDGLVVEGNTSNYYRNPYYLLPTLSYGDLTTGIRGSYYILAPYCQGIITDDSDDALTIEAILKTSDKAYAHAGDTKLNKIEMQEGDVEGPFSIGAMSRKALDDETSATMVVYSCSQIFTSNVNTMVSGANQMLFVNTISTFADHDYSVSIPAKDYTISYLTVTESSAIGIGLMTIVIIPVGCLAAGLIIWLKRRKR